MKRNLLIWLGASVAAVTATAIIIPGQVNAWRQTHGLNSIHVTYLRQPCAGAPCPAYQVDIYGDGTIIYKGLDQVATPGSWTYHVKQKVLHAWLSDFRVSSFWHRPRSIAPAADGGTCQVSMVVDRKSVSNGCYNFSGDDGLTLESPVVAAEVTQLEAVIGLDRLTRPHAASDATQAAELAGLKRYKSNN